MATNSFTFEFSKQAQKVMQGQGPNFQAKVLHQLNLFTESRQNHGLSFEKLLGQHGACSIRLNGKCRLIIIKTGNQLQLERILLNHEYERLNISVSSRAERPLTVDDELTFIGETFSKCSEIQRDVLDKPRFQNVEMILGFPGTGKSILLCRAIAERMDSDTKVLYLCPTHMIETMQRLFQLQGVGSNVIVTDYANYMGIDASFEDMTDLKNWLGRAKKTHGKITPFLTDALAQDFELISAIGPDKYLEKETTQSCYPCEQRNFVLELFQLYMGEGYSRKNIRLFKMLPVSPIPTCVDIVAMDEFQSYSPTQVANFFSSLSLFKNSSQLQIFVAGDENQNPFTASSQLPFLRKIIQDHRMSLCETRLNKGFRCPPSVETLASQLLAIRRQCFGEPHRSVESAYEPQVLESHALQHENCISHVSDVGQIPQPPGDFYVRLQYVVITDHCFIEEARRHFTRGTLIISHQQALGVEFNHVVLWRPFSHEVFKVFNNKLKTSEQHVGRGILADEVTAHTEVQKVFTSILRTKQQLVIYEPKRFKHLYKALGLASGVTLSIDVDHQVSEQEIKARIDELIKFGALDQQSLEINLLQPVDNQDARSAATTPLLPAIEQKFEIVLAPEEQTLLEKFSQKVKDKPSFLGSVLKTCVKKPNAEDCLHFIFHNSSTNLFQFILERGPLLQELIKQLINDSHLFFTEFHTRIAFSSKEWQLFQEFRATCQKEKFVKNSPLVHQLMKSRQWNGLLDSYCELGGDINLKSPKDNNTLLHDVISLEQSKVSKILEMGADVNAQNCHGLTPFHVVIGANISPQKKLNLITLFLKFGRPHLDSTLNIRDLVLGYAINHNQIDVVKLLVETDKTCIEFCDKDNISFLSHAIFENSHIDIISYFLGVGFEPNGRSFGDITNLSSAITLNRLDIVDVLLNQPTIDPNFGERFTPLMVAIMDRKSQKIPIISRLLKHPRIDVNRETKCLSSFFSRGAGVRDEKSQAQSCQVSNQADHSSIDGGLLVSFPLHDAVAFCKPDVVKLLLAHGANPNSLDHDGNNALHVAVKTKNIEIIKFILNSDVDINHNNFKHMTPLFHAIDDQELKIVKLICQTGKVNLNILFGPEQYSYLSFLICECPDSKEILKVLLSHGANPNLLHDENVTPLYLAAQENRKELVDLLLDFGAKPNLATVDNITPLMIASKHPNSSELIHSLLSHKADVDTKRLSNSSTPLMLAVQNDAAKVADTLLKAKANVNESSLSQVTPLSLAISKENTRILEILVKHGANLNQIIHDGLTPLMYAVELGCPEVIRKLLEYEMVEVNAISNGCTALILACEEGHIELVQLLLEKGGDSNIVKGEHSPLFIAVLLQNLPMAQMLLSYGAQANPKCEPYPLVKAMSNKQDAMVELLLKNGAAADVSLTGPNSIWISAIQSGHPPNLRQLRDKLGGSFGEIVLDDKTHLSVAIDFRAKAVIEWLLRQPGVTPSSTELALIRILTHLIAIDRVIEDAYILRRQFSVPSENNLKKREGLGNVLEDLKKVQYQFSQLSLVSGLTYVDNLVQQLRSLIDEIQSIYDRHYKYDGRLSPN